MEDITAVNVAQLRVQKEFGVQKDEFIKNVRILQILNEYNHPWKYYFEGEDPWKVRYNIHIKSNLFDITYPMTFEIFIILVSLYTVDYRIEEMNINEEYLKESDLDIEIDFSSVENIIFDLDKVKTPYKIQNYIENEAREVFASMYKNGYPTSVVNQWRSIAPNFKIQSNIPSIGIVLSDPDMFRVLKVIHKIGEGDTIPMMTSSMVEGVLLGKRIMDEPNPLMHVVRTYDNKRLGWREIRQ